MAEKDCEDSLLEVEDEKQLLQLIKKRFSKDQVYNLIDDVAISINPCRILPDESWKLYQIADRAIHHLRLHQKNQCIVLTGDSGSGKTENAKKFITRIINSVSALGEDLVNNITQAGIILESFGNACTLTCDNASRYIRFTELLFTQDFRIKGAYIHHYLLEKTRVAQHDKAEGNFHIFYQFLIGMSDEGLEKYGLQKSVYHRYIGYDFDWTRDQERFQDELNEVNDCFRSLGFSEENLDTIFRILAAILHIGDLTFAVNIKEKKAGVVHLDPLRKASQLLRVSPEKLEFALVTELTHVKGKVARRLRRVDEVDDARDKLAMALYGRLFAWIVWKINRYLTPIDDEKSDGSVIYVLDPFGFEKLELNGMEQLCINTTNEHLSYLYNQCVFAWEMEDLDTEGILIQKVDYMNNKEIVDFLMERPQGIFAVIDRYAKTIHPTDSKLMKKLNSKHFKHTRYEEVSNCPYPAFTISHYAGKVTYTALNMLNGNKNMLGGSIILCIQDSTDDLIRRLFMVHLSPTGAISTADHASMDGMKMPCKAKIKKLRGTVRRKTEMIGSIQGFAKSKQSKDKMIQEQAYLTLTSQLRNSLSDLVQRFLKCDLHFVRCIRPNHQLIPYHFDDELVNTQLTYSSVMETVLIRQQGFPVRVAFGPFINRYRILAYRSTMNVKYVANTCEKILWTISGLEWKIAKTKVFMKNSCREKLEHKLLKTQQGIVIIQKLFRGRIARRKFKVLQFQKERERAIVQDFLSQVEIRMAMVFNHFYNQVTEEDGRSKTNTSKRSLVVNNDEIKEMALNILMGNKGKWSKNSSSQLSSPDSREDLPKSSTPDLPNCDDESDSATMPGHNPLMIDALNVSPVQVTQPSHLDRKSDSETDEEPKIPQTTGELSPDGSPLLWISNIFEVDAVSPVLSPTSTSFDVASDEDLYSPEPINSITDIFSSENIDMHQEHLPETSSKEETLAEQSITDVFNDTPTNSTIVMSTECDTLLDRPTLAGRESNLSTVSYESTMSKDTDDDLLVNVSMESPGLWCTITCYERDISRGEFHVDRPVIIVDGSSNAFDVTRIGIGSMPITPGDNKVEKVRLCVGKGIKLTKDEKGNMWVKRCSKNNVFVKGHHLSSEVMEAKGVLPKGKLLKIFDFDSFADNLKYVCDPKRYEPGKSEDLLASTKVCICFVKDADQDIDAPCWIEVKMTEQSRVTKVALDLAKDIRRQEREKRGDRTPPILRAKIGKSRQAIAVETWEKKVRPKTYIDSFKYRRRGWARKNVSVNPFDFGFQSHLEKVKAESSKLRTQSSPGNLESFSPNDEFGVNDDVFEASAQDVRFNTSEGTSKSKMFTRANTEGQILSQNMALEVGKSEDISKSKFNRANTEGQILSKTRTEEEGKKKWAKEKLKDMQVNNRRRLKTTS